MSFQPVRCVFVVGVVFVAWCGFLAAQEASEAKSPASSTLKTPASADLSSPKAAFVSLGKTRQELDARGSDDSSFQRFFGGGLSADQRTLCTKALVEFHDTQQAGRRVGKNASRKQGGYAFVRESRHEDGDVTVEGTSDTSVTTTIADDETGQAKTQTEQSTSKARARYRKIGEEWRVVSLEKECSLCAGSGKCGECGGTGVTKEQDCYACGGSGKAEPESCYVCEGSGALEGEPCPECQGSGQMTDRPCYACEGKGKSTPTECHWCDKKKGVCGSCDGSGWSRDDDFEGAADFPLLRKPRTVAPFKDLSTPHNTVKSFLNAKERETIEGERWFSGMIADLNAVIATYFLPDRAAAFIKTVESSVAEIEKWKLQEKQVVGEPTMDGERATVTVTSTERRAVFAQTGKSHEFKDSKEFFRLVKDGGEWKVDDTARPCYACDGAGTCGLCHGTGKTPEETCYTCQGSGKAEPEPCAACEGAGTIDGNPCPDCAGAGKVADQPCFSCEGKGKIPPGECFNCKETQGKCGECQGSGASWERSR